MAFAAYPAKPGLFLHVDAGALLLNGAQSAITAVDLSVPANTTSYVFIDLIAVSISSNTTGFPANSFPLATIVTNNDRVTSVTDNRPDYVVSVA